MLIPASLAAYVDPSLERLLSRFTAFAELCHSVKGNVRSPLIDQGLPKVWVRHWML